MDIVTQKMILQPFWGVGGGGRAEKFFKMALLIMLCSRAGQFSTPDAYRITLELAYDHCQWQMNTVEFQWLEHLWNHENMFDTGVVRANQCLS